MASEQTVVVSARMTVEEAEELDRVGTVEPAVKNRSSAVRRLIAASSTVGAKSITKAAVTGAELRLGRRAAHVPERVRDALALRDAVLHTREELTVAMGAVEKQTRAAGYSLNQIARACNVLAFRRSHGVGPVAPFDEGEVAALKAENDRLIECVEELSRTVSEKFARLDELTRKPTPRSGK